VERLAEADPPRRLRQRLAAHDGLFPPGEHSFVGVGIAPHEPVGDEEAEERVPQELEPLPVVAGPRRALVRAGAVGQRPEQEGGIGEPVAETALEVAHGALPAGGGSFTSSDAFRNSRLGLASPSYRCPSRSKVYAESVSPPGSTTSSST
jgi:hypothetical protein